MIASPRSVLVIARTAPAGPERVRECALVLARADGGGLVGTIVVGVDGSAGAMAAAHFAVEEARIRKATLRLVAAWHVPAMAYGNAFAVGPGDLPEAMHEVADGVIAQTLAELGELGEITVERHVEAGPAAQVLLAQAAGAELLVVGSRGHGGFTELLLGSVSQQCAHHAPCPVVIVRAGASPG